MSPLLVATAVLAAVAAVAVLAVVGLAVAVTTSVSGRRRAERELRTARESVDRLRARVEELSHAVDVPSPHRPPGQEFLITSLGDEPSTPADQRDRAPQLPAPAFVSLATRESLIRLVSLGHGVRRALSAESRNRIRFEVGREIRRARKARRRDLKEARRHLRAQSVQGAR
jgi:hypothetical protein